MRLKLDALPAATRKLYERAAESEALQPFTLMGGTALALQIGHRQSVDLDFATFSERLPVHAIERWISGLRGAGLRADNIVSPSQSAAFRINTGTALEHFAQDYEVEGVKVTFFAHGRNEAQRAYYQNAQRVEGTGSQFSVMGIEGLKASKTLVLGDRARSRDLYDVMVLMRDHGLTIDDMADYVATLGQNNDFERYTAVMTGEIPLDDEDEGLVGGQPPVTATEITDWLGAQVDKWQIARAHDPSGPR